MAVAVQRREHPRWGAKRVGWNCVVGVRLVVTELEPGVPNWQVL